MSGCNWTEQDLRDWLAKQAPGAAVILSDTREPGRRTFRPTHGVMNKTEAAYATTLEARKQAGEIRDWRFESITLKLAERSGEIAAVRYTPDFSVIPHEGPVQMIEIKAGRKRKSGRVAAHFEDGAREKFLWAAREFPEYEWYLAWRWKDRWETERISA